MEAVRNDQSGIGYVGVGYVKNDQSGLNVLKVATKVGGEYADPLNMDDVNSGRYPISRPLNQYIAGDPSGVAKEFLEFEVSAQGQKVVEEEGFFEIPEEYQKFNAQAGL